ncbi:hypothetical protein BDW69DRAFT_59384 [Aspergillus filifer]
MIGGPCMCPSLLCTTAALCPNKIRCRCFPALFDTSAEFSIMEPPIGLRGFSRLNNQVSLCTSGQKKASTDKQPSLVIVCAWLFAAPKHIAKYTQLYQTNMPAADILLIQPVVGDMIWTSNSAQLQQLNPAVATIDVFLDSSQVSNRRLIFHIFSNAGSHAAVQLAEAYQLLHPSATLPVTSLVLDSCPGAPSAMLSASAMILALPNYLLVKVIGAALIYTIVGAVALLDSLGVYQNVIAKTRRALNDPSGCFLWPGMGRVYLYSQSDVMVPWRDIVEHADEARRVAEGRCSVQTVEFYGSGHVGHLAVSGDKYVDVILSVIAGI